MIRLLVTTQKALLWGALVPYLRSRSLRYQFSSANHSLKTFSETTQNYKTGDKFHTTLSSVMNSMSPFYPRRFPVPRAPTLQTPLSHSHTSQSDQLSLNHYLIVAFKFKRGQSECRTLAEISSISRLLHTVPMVLKTNQPYKQFSCRSMIQQTGFQQLKSEVDLIMEFIAVTL